MTGCFEGGVYFLTGSKEGKFAAPEKLLDKAGNILRLGQYWDYEATKWAGVESSQFKDQLGIGATPVDWDDDGDLDLLIGSLVGQLFVRLNEGSATEPAFATESIQLTIDGQPLQVPGHDTIPKVVDWDGDGLFDILSGSGEGGVYWLRNVGKQGSPEFAKAEQLIRPTEHEANPKTAQSAADTVVAGEPTWPGQRTQVCAADYDGDGDLDLLIGDCHFPTGAANQPNSWHGWIWLFRQK